MIKSLNSTYAKPLPPPLPGTERGVFPLLPLPSQGRGPGVRSDTPPRNGEGEFFRYSPCPLREGGRGVRSDA